MQASYQPQMMVMMVVVARMVVQMMHAQLSSASEAVGLLDRVSSPISRGGSRIFRGGAPGANFL